MWKSMVGVGVICAALFAADRWLTSSETDERVKTKKVGRLVPFAERGVKPPEALEVEFGRGTKVRYARMPDGWRCLTYRNAVANEERVKGVANKLFEAEGIVQTRDPARAAEFGLEVNTTITIRPYLTRAEMESGGRPLVEIEVGRPVENDAGSFMRRAGELDIWAVDSNPHLELARAPESPMPPMLDPSIVPMSWLQNSKQVKGIKIERGDLPPVELEMREKQVSPEEIRQGKMPFDWVSKSSAGEKVCDSNLSMSFTSFLMRAPYSDLVDPAQIPGLGFEKSNARITLIPREGASLELYVKPSPMAGRAVVYNSASQSAYELPADYANLLMPTEEQLVNPASANPWKTLLQQQR